MLAVSYSELLNSNSISYYYDNGRCHDCIGVDANYDCEFECEHEEGYEDENGTLNLTNAKKYFCYDCFKNFEECGCGCMGKICNDCAKDCDRCRECNAPLCRDDAKCRCAKKK